MKPTLKSIPAKKQFYLRRLQKLRGNLMLKIVKISRCLSVMKAKKASSTKWEKANKNQENTTISTQSLKS
jgi:hypothetical protein